MNIIGLLVCGANEKYLENTLKEFKRLCDDTMVVTNNADEKTKQLIKEYGFKQYEDNREWAISQPSIKSDLLKRAGEELKPDWLLCLDADEIYSPNFTREEAEKLASGKEIAYYFMIVNLYNDKDHFVHGAGIQRFWNIRFYKYLPEYGLQFLKKNLHCGLAPPVAYKYGWYAPFYVEHYGLMLKEDRIRKAERYKKYDPTKRFKAGSYYDELVMDLHPIIFDRKRTLQKLKEAKECQTRKTPNALQ